MASIEEKFQYLLDYKIGLNTYQMQEMPNGKLCVQVEPDNVLNVVNLLIENDEKAGIGAITGVDNGDNYELLYHFRSMDTIITIRTNLPKDNPEIASIIDLLPGANFHEKEVTDLLGIVFTGNPLHGRFLLPEGWPKDNYPLRKDAEIPSIDSLIKSAFTDENETNKTFNLTLGPQHPALLEPEKFVVHVEGETVKEITPRIGYVHRGVEKATESRTYLQDLYLVERICGICNCCHVSGFSQSVEAILGIEVPRRARYLRTIVDELNRLHSHMLLYGHAGFEIGYESLFQYTWRDRELVMDLIEMVTGNRVNTSFIVFGGVRRDINDAQIARIKSTLDTLEKRMDFYRDLFASDSSILGRLKGVGVLSREDALKYCVVGPVARASGVDIDARKDDPYAAYDEIPFKLCTYTEGDTLARLKIRIDEIYESIHIIDYAINNLPEGEIRVKVPRSVTAGEAVCRVEAPRGELMYYVKSNGTQSPERVKVRTPTFSNILAFVHVSSGIRIADIPAVLVSWDPCFSCTDR